AYASALTEKQASDLRALLDDRDPDVRAAAWAREAQLHVDPEHDARAAGDPSPQVRLAALPLLDPGKLANDESFDVRLATDLASARRSSRTAAEPGVLYYLGHDDEPHLLERARMALLWLLAT
ncbi:MAG: hypothetical protein ACM31C_03770, partial [Acidobacteriota bacterium]